MKIAMIAAMAHDRVIGKDNQMPWHMPADLAHFKRTTLGKPVIMGRKTYESIGRALPGRLNIVITTDQSYTLADAEVVNSIDAALEMAQNTTTDEVMIIGGGTIYANLLPRAHRLYLTLIDLHTSGDTYFPDYNAQGNWQVTDEQRFASDDKNPHAYRFLTLERQ
ncbi:type 3 dihydrofolate reductase [Alteromonas lipolytica]|uniref:Dihydrofolate reductase n=1 Tax=Alteromonas lipolytica TaxID=1856405 RepID=A0A1E8FGD5_9ALTE|nr:type 3 dihydrofolate reductase [Alteromonas lipolytica]OFI34523.1 diacylglycerol kinase [Alteromonas lipolytica]GGF85214.1 dihydrofolate reductase [Alteromonas lipolytica]